MQFLLFLLLTTTASAEPVILSLEKSPHARLKNVPLSAVRITSGFWAERRRINVERSIPTMLELLEEHGVMDNFRRLSGRKSAARRGPLYTDSDIYKWMEAVGFVLQSEDHPALRAAFERLTEDILAAQEPSGYLNTYYQDDLRSKRFTEMHRGHELYCLGHLLEAAIAYYRATGNRRLLDGGIRFVEYLLSDFGPDKRPLLAGHPNIEMALIELYRTAADKRYLDLAAYILRGDGEKLKLTPAQLTYMFSGKPFIERTILEGHAVRAGYAAAGAADYLLETGDPAYKRTLDLLWDDLVRHKMYVTGGIGSRAEGEAFGEAYELPNARAYTESCAAIANMMWNWRMLAATGDAKYADVIETALYNSINSGMSLDGTLYCYRNPLELRGDAKERIRNPWYSTTCCPPNLERILASLPGYLYSTSQEGLYVHLYENSTLNGKLADGSPIGMTQSTRYPWEGGIDIAVNPSGTKEFTLLLRIPGWAAGAQLSVNGKSLGAVKPGEYFAVRRNWRPGDRVRLSLPMDVQLLVAHPLVKENSGRVAVRRGPLIYTLEQTDQPSGVSVLESALVLSSEPAKDFTAEFRQHLLGGVVVLKHRGVAPPTPYAQIPLYQSLAVAPSKPGKPVDLVLVPYYTFSNRGPAAMQVWMPYLRR